MCGSDLNITSACTCMCMCVTTCCPDRANQVSEFIFRRGYTGFFLFFLHTLLLNGCLFFLKSEQYRREKLMEASWKYIYTVLSKFKASVFYPFGGRTTPQQPEKLTYYPFKSFNNKITQLCFCSPNQYSLSFYLFWFPPTPEKNIWLVRC